MNIEDVKDKAAYKRGRDSTEMLIKHCGYAKAVKVVEGCIVEEEYNDFDRGAEAVLKEHSIKG